MPNTHSPAKAPVLLSIILSGLLGEIAFELYAWVISPILFGFSLEPANLVIAVTSRLTGASPPYSAAFGVHVLIGSLGFGLFVHFIRRAFGLRAWLTGALAGLALWFVAQGILAPFIGRSFMMDFGPYTQSSFIGHLGMTLVIAHFLDLLLHRVQRREPQDTPARRRTQA